MTDASLDSVADHGRRADTMRDGHGADSRFHPRAFVSTLMSEQLMESETSTTVGLLNSLCRAAAQHMGAAGVAIGLRSESGSAGVVASADDRSVLLDELQFSLGEGPSGQAFTTRRPVLVADLASTEGHAWPIYSASALESGVTGVFAFPLHVGAAAFGVLTVYTSAGGTLGRDQMNVALTFAEVATEILVDAGSALSADTPHSGVVEAAQDNRAEIYQAQGVTSVHLDISLAESMVRMRAHAFYHGLSLAELAALIMSGHVDLRTERDQ